MTAPTGSLVPFVLMIGEMEWMPRMSALRISSGPCVRMYRRGPVARGLRRTRDFKSLNGVVMTFVAMVVMVVGLIRCCSMKQCCCV